MSAAVDSHEVAANGADEISDSLENLNMQDSETRLGPDGEIAPKTEEEYAETVLTLRAIVSSKEAGVIIGKAGKNVADLRDETGVKAGVSKVVQGVHDRVLTITGGCQAVSKAYAIVAKGLLEGAPMMGMGGVVSTNGTHRKITTIFLTSVASDANFFISNQASHLPQPDGHDNWTPGSQDQAYTRCVWCAHGRSKGYASAINRAHC